MRKLKKFLLTAGLLLTTSVSLGVMSACKDKKVEYTFNTNGGASIDSVKVSKGDEYVLPTLTREGYEFLGWYTSADFSGAAVTTVKAEANQTYYAKWEQLCLLTLDLDGGTLAQGKNTFYLKDGANVYDFLNEYVPTKTGLQFGAWELNNGKDISTNTKITKDGMTLKAKYKQAYVIELWLQNDTQSGYEKASENVTAYEYAGVSVTAKHTLVGFKEVSNADTVKTKTISTNATENVFKLYFNRETYRVTFNANYPNGETSPTKVEPVLYGKKIQVPVDYTTEGYCLMGWATTRSGEVVYEANYIDSVIYNKEGESKADFVEPTRDMTLYAVWVEGIPDMFGTDDFMYLFGDDAEVIYLHRGNTFFVGEYDADDKEFIFWDSNNEVLLEGKVNSNGTYTYYDSNRVSAKTLYGWNEAEDKMGLIDSTTIYFDAFDGITYTVKDAAGKTSNSEGTYIIDENGFYIATFTSGDLKNKTLTIAVGNVQGEDGSALPAFRVRNEEEYKVGELSRLGIQNNRLILDDKNTVKLDGFGNATLSGRSYSYRMDTEKNVIRILDSYGEEAYALRIVEEGELKGYTFYYEDLDTTFTLENGARLLLDGMYNAKYVGDTTVNAYFTLKDSVFGGAIVCLTDASEHTFLLKELPKDEGEEDEPVEYTVEEKAAGYAEYYYKDANGTYYAPLLVLNESKDVPATLYAYTASKTYVKVSTGTLEENTETGLYLYTAGLIEKNPEGALDEPVDLTKVKAFTCALDSELTAYQISFWYDYTDENDRNTVLSEVYTSSSGATLTLVGGFAIYNENSNITTGTYADRGEYIQVSTGNSSFYVTLDKSGTEKTFVRMNHTPFTATVEDASGKENKKEYVKFDGTGSATYYVENDEGEVVKTYVGTVNMSEGETLFGVETGKFTSDEKTFVFLLLSRGAQTLIRIPDANLQGEFATSAGTLTLDGFGYQASLMDKDGQLTEGRYAFNDEGLLVFANNSGEALYYFEKTNDKYNALGGEYGDYEVFKNRYTSDLWVKLNGKGGATVYKKDENGNKTNVAENETYTMENGVCVLSYEFEGKKLRGLLESGKFFSENDTKGRTLVSSKDWSVLILDDYGNATKYDTDGVKYKGTYVLITDTLLYFASNDNTHYSLYQYDMAAGSIKTIKFTDVTYCTKDLETLNFTSYGFAVFNGEDEYFYNVVNSQVVLYRKAEAGEDTKFGFVEETFGSLDDTKTWDGKNYYKTSGGVVTFKRDADTAGEFAKNGAITDLSFTPQGSGSFKVNGYVVVNGVRKACTVVRNVEDDVTEMYITVGNYRYDISVNYFGDTEDDENKNFYTVSGLKWIVAAPSYSYLSALYTLYSWYGSAASSYQNEIGEITLIQEYDAEGNTVENGFYMTGKFGEGSKMFDTKGEVITFEKAVLSFNEETMIYTAKFEKDGYVYAIYFQLATHPAFRINAYRLYAFTRQEVVKTDPNSDNGYTVYASKIIATETNIYKVGGIYSIALQKGGVDYNATSLYTYGTNVAYYVAREKDGDLYTTATYYVISLVDSESGSVGKETDIIPTYESVTVEEIAVKTVYTEDNKSFVDLDEAANTIKYLRLGDKNFVIQTCVYENGVYTVTSTGGKVFTVKVENGKAVITEEK